MPFEEPDSETPGHRLYVCLGLSKQLIERLHLSGVKLHFYNAQQHHNSVPDSNWTRTT